ncbi:MAG TPA: HAMP domain-containing sensor histidine kinase [Microbacterium sp.]|uniref:sensor histidine kinase n=1 Tax=Microbacterium sp. TaxID=51671 RepID=UPI002B46560B|nr:HAMP domain-containing sensor histidine kinase [Microbacterium sp.]HKT55317.1 HAMP domain-containing sensor histidine kinase [Microbacterium sp.]
MIRPGDLAAIVGVALACALLVGAVGLLALRLARRRSILLQVSIVVLTGTIATAVGMAAVARAMFLSPHDLLVSLWVAGVAAVVSLGVAVVLAATFVRQARRVRSIAEALGAGGAVVPPDASTSELAAVAEELARTSRRLEDARSEVATLDASRRELIAWISHDLRTPLAGLRAMAEALEDGLADDPQRFHRQMRLQVDHLSDLVDDLFELSKIQSGRLVLTFEAVSLHDLVSDAVAELRTLAESRDVTIRESPSPDVFVRGDARELGRVVGNLLMNAIQYSPPGRSVSVTTEQDAEGRAVLSVVDEGGGIPAEDLENVFRAGWRAAASRTPRSAADRVVWGRSSGAGLGLAIAHGIVVAHDGEIRARNVGGGSRFDVILPGVPA